MKKRMQWRDKTMWLEKVKESLLSVLPIFLIIFILSITVAPIDSGTFLVFIIGTAFVFLGTGVFTLGADVAMTPVGEYIGFSTIRTRKLWLIIFVLFFMGIFITIAEPDLQVLAGQLAKTINKWTLLIAVGVGVGVFLVIAFLRIILKVKFSYLIVFLYAIVFTLSFFVPKAFVPLAFDSGGVTTGPMSVPFIIAIGTGIASVHTEKKGDGGEFGLTALCSVGPIIAVMILGIIFKPESITATENVIPVITNSKELISFIVHQLPHYFKEVAIALLPIVVVFLLSQLYGDKIGKKNYVRILIGILYTYLGLVLFLVGVNVGFLPVGSYLGGVLGNLNANWIVIPIGMLLGFFVVAAEPAVHVLQKQVFEITLGAISKRALKTSLMIGVSVSVGIAMLRILFHIPIMYFLIPGYLIALVLSFIVPDFFTAIAFDSGGVASGAMTASFIMPFAIGVCASIGGNVALEGFGVVAMVAMTPLITIQILGLVYKIKLKKYTAQKEQNPVVEDIID